MQASHNLTILNGLGITFTKRGLATALFLNDITGYPMTLTAQQKKQLKSQAHHLKPIVQLGNNGLTEAVLNEIDRALTDHELIKVKIPTSDREARQAITADICQQQTAELVQSIGHTIVIYRESQKE